MAQPPTRAPGIPRHVAVIMDGNGRWAKQKGEERIFGHHHGVTAVRETTESAAELGIQTIDEAEFLKLIGG
mgnify:CR=1 FL=1